MQALPAIRFSVAAKATPVFIGILPQYSFFRAGVA
jgi:hypothetical protein